jgi:hypothetical protein
MPAIPSPEVSMKTNKYPIQPLDSAYGTTIKISLYKTDAVVYYDLVAVLGTLSGGTSPAWTVSASNPLITHITVKADNTTYFDADAQLIQEYEKLARNFSPNGLSFPVSMADTDYSSGTYIMSTIFPSYRFSQVDLYLTIAPLGTVTSGSPTASSGTNLYIVEHVVPRPLVNFTLYPNMKLQVSTNLSATGDNYLTDFIARDGLYHSIMFAAATAQGYSNLSDSVINYITLKLNNLYEVTDTYWAQLKNATRSLFQITPDTGYAVLSFMKKNDSSTLLDLSDPNAVKSATLKVNTSSTGFLYALMTKYL